MYNFKQLIDKSVKPNARLSKSVSITLDVNGEAWQAYHVDVSHRDLLFTCDMGTCTFFVDSYGETNTAELFDWNKDTL
jgi:hypothetical protein